MSKERHKNVPACNLLLIQDNKVLLLRRANTNHELGNYSMAGGHVEKQETFVQAMIREAKEEVGIDILPQDLRIVHLMHRGLKQNDFEYVNIFFTATKWTGKIVNAEPHKCDDLSWFDLDKLPNNTVSYIRQAIKNVKENRLYSEHGW